MNIKKFNHIFSDVFFPPILWTGKLPDEALFGRF